jgi:CRP-like cAMP-binding protein
MDLSPAVLATLQKLRLFRDLSPSQLKALFKLCQQKSYAQDRLLCRAGGVSDKMFILLAGSVDVLNTSGDALVSESATTTIGEAGLLTGEPRAASVRARTAVSALVIERRPLMRLVQDDAILAIRLFRNVLAMVREKLIVADQRITEML